MKKIIGAVVALMATLGLSACATSGQGGSTEGQGGTGSIISLVVIYGLIILAFYFLFIRPNSKKKKQEEEMRKNLEIGDEIITIGGVTGRIVNIKDDDSFVLETGPDRTKIVFQKWALSSVVTEKEPVEVDTKKDKKNDKKKSKEKVEEK